MYLDNLTLLDCMRMATNGYQIILCDGHIKLVEKEHEDPVNVHLALLGK